MSNINSKSPISKHKFDENFSNIVLIGMSGSGKTSIGKILAENLSLSFIDTDEMIVERVKMSVKEIFALEGEEKFRQYERSCTLEASERKNTVISTGGGIILNEENMINLKKNGIIFFIDRSIASIAQSANLNDRPLIQNDRQKLQNLYNERIELYKNYAMYCISNEESVEIACQKIIEIYQ